MTSPLSFKNGEKLTPGKIVCVGRNYADHARELGNRVPDEPVIFLKPSTSLAVSGEKVHLPRDIGRIDHEIELAVVMADTVQRVDEKDAMRHVLGYAVFLDITARDLQDKAKKKGLPWTISKGYDGFAPISPITKAGEVSQPHELSIVLEVNNEIRQEGNTRDMIFPIPKLIEYVAGIMTLERGDIIATGTPAGVSPIFPGDHAVGRIQDVGEIDIEFT